ncbi:hypothetical protein L7F22_016754 [Adiantum nelumboides]|nr:hypothetical protein [Adiantum nelumboides]
MAKDVAVNNPTNGMEELGGTREEAKLGVLPMAEDMAANNSAGDEYLVHPIVLEEPVQSKDIEEENNKSPKDDGNPTFKNCTDAPKEDHYQEAHVPRDDFVPPNHNEAFDQPHELAISRKKAMAKDAVGPSAQAEDSPSLPEPCEESLKFIGFKMERMGSDCVEGRFVVSENSCQGQQTHEVGESSRPPQTDDDIFRTQLITAVTMFTQVMQNPRFLAFLQPPLPSQQVGSLDNVQKPVKAQAQPFGVLHGGVSALIAEALASSGAFFASGHHRVAGVQLTINHVKAAPIGTEVLASAKPVHVGQRTQVWDVILTKSDKSASNPSQGTRVALARVTIMVDPSGPVVTVDGQGRPLARL